jgi:cytochrome P450
MRRVASGSEDDEIGSIGRASAYRRCVPLMRGRCALPPGPRMPSAIQALGWSLRPLAFMESCEREYGEMFTLRIRRGRPWVFITNPEHVKQVFTTNPTLVGAGAGEANPLLEPLLGERSVMLLDEPRHLNDRKTLLPSFHGGRTKRYGELMAEVARTEIDSWPVGRPFALWPRMQAISMQVVMRVVFGEADPARMECLRKSLVALTDWLNNRRRLALLAAIGAGPIRANAGFRAVMQPVEDLVLEEVRMRRSSPDRDKRDDILSALEHAYGVEDGTLGERKMRDELVTMLSDGPTATSLAWAFERLLRHPDKLERLRDEVLSGERDGYLEAVVKETLRLCPAVPVVMRRLVEPMRLGGYELPANAIVAPCIFLMHRRSDIYPEPRAFRPERFLAEAAGTYTWIPFGGGVRRCVAANFAQLEMKKVIETVIKEVELKAIVSGAEGVARSSVSFVPDAGALVLATRRRSTATKVRAVA